MDEMRRMVDTLNDYAYKYYVLDDPIVSDGEYDALYDKLVALEKETGVILADSPTQRVGGETLAGFRKHTHLAPLYSLDKAQTKEELGEFVERVKKVNSDAEFTLEYKFDGLTVNLTYDNGELVEASTRGDGIAGEAVLAQVKTIKSIPLSIPFKGKMEVQGEAVMRISDFNAYNETAAEPLKNPRNGAAGALRNLDPRETARRRLTVYLYSVGYIEGRSFATHMEMIEFLKANRFKVSDYCRVYRNAEDIFAAVDEVGEKRGTLDFMIDGMVLKAADTATRAKLGYTQKFPKWAIAYKFPAEEATTTIRDIVWEVGRTGRITPTAELEPVEIAGATIRRATLNNIDDIERKKAAVGARVFIRRSNDVIPEILGAVSGQREFQKAVPPDRCPACGAKTELIGPNLYCPNTVSCQPQLERRLVHYASRDAMDIEGLSEKTVDLLFQNLGVEDIAAIYSLTKEQLLTLPGFKDKRADNLIAAIEESKRPELGRFIYALGINNVGKKTANDLAAHYKTFDALRNATAEELTAIRDIGDIVAECIVDFFASEQVEDTLQRLFDAGVSPREAEEKEGVFKGKKVVLTGSLENYTRSEAGEIIESLGGELASSVGKSTDLVIAGAKAGSKLAKAEALGIPVINEAEFIAILEEK